MITHRRVDIEHDKDIQLDFHSQANYAVADEWIRSSTVSKEFRDH